MKLLPVLFYSCFILMRGTKSEIHIKMSKDVKRYAIFPKGSVFTVAICVTLKLLTPDYDIFTEAVNWALTYNLPSSLDDYDRMNLTRPLPTIARRKRAEFYQTLETIFNEKGIDGRACILRSLCEVRQIVPENNGFLETLVKILFRMPFEKVDVGEPWWHYDYDRAFRNGHGQKYKCRELFSSCPFSFVNFILNLRPVEV